MFNLKQIVKNPLTISFTKSWLLMVSKRELSIFLLIFTLIAVALAIVGYQESLENDKEKDDTGEYVYKSPEDAIKDVDSKALIEAVENKGYFVYRDPKDVLQDIDEEYLVDELRYKKKSHFYKTDRN